MEPLPLSQARIIKLLRILLYCTASLSTSAGLAQQSGNSNLMSYRVDIHFTTKAERSPVPFDLLQGLIVFKAQINGEDVWGTFDNMSEDSLIDAKFATSHNLKVGPFIAPLHTPTGILQRQRIENVDVRIPGQIDLSEPMSAVDLSFLSKVTGRPISLVLGKEYFHWLAFFIRSDKRNFELAPSGAIKIPDKYPYVVLRGDRPQVAATVDGEPVALTVDMGFNGFAALSQAAWTKLNLDKRSTSKKAAHFEGHVQDVKAATVDKMTLGPATVNQVEVRLEPSFPEDSDGLIGLAFLSRFTFVIDETNRRLWFISNSK